MSEEKDYRPRSPDLSEFLPRNNQPRPRLPSFHPSDSSFPPGYAFSPRGSYDASPYFSPQTAQGSYFATQNHPAQLHSSPKNSRTSSLPPVPQHTFSPPRQTFPQDQAQARYPPPLAFNTPTYASPATYQTQHSFNHPPPTLSDPMARTRAKRPVTYFEGDDADDTYDQPTAASQHIQQPTAPLAMPSGPLELTIDVKTKFPVARIKRIMQADEDVGKVAQATPTAVAKALELFMVTLVTKGAAEARNSGNSKRITAQHLAKALMADPQFDFLSEQCANIPDEGGAGSKKGRAKSEGTKSEDFSDDEEMSNVPRKKSKSARKSGHDD